MFIAAFALCSVMSLTEVCTVQGKSRALTVESVAESIRILARERMHLIPLARSSKSLEALSKELIRLNQASEETIKQVGGLLGGNEDSPIDGEMIISRLLFLLRYCPPPEPGGYSRDIFIEYHEHLKVPPLNNDEFKDRDAYRDYPTPEQFGEGKWLTLDRRDYYDWPWRLTKDGWQIRLFTYSMGSGMQDYDSMYEKFSKLPLRKGVNVKKETLVKQSKFPEKVWTIQGYRRCPYRTTTRRVRGGGVRASGA